MILFTDTHGATVAFDPLAIVRVTISADPKLCRVHTTDGEYTILPMTVSEAAGKIGAAQEQARACIGTAQ